MDTEISRTSRYLAPAHYSLKVEKFSLMSKIEKHETGVFEAGGYTWRLVFYPYGDKKNDGQNHVSMYLEILETESFPAAWEVNVSFKLFVHNQIHDTYLVIQDLENGGVKRFNALKTMWGFAKLLPLETLKDSSKGYIVSDACVFGAEVFVIKQAGKGESLSLVHTPNIVSATFKWEIENFSEIEKETYNSKVFTVGGRDWMLVLYLKEDLTKRGKSLSVHLKGSDWKSEILSKAGLHTEYKLRLMDQVNGKHLEKEARRYFEASEPISYGHTNMISVEDLATSGFIVNDSLTVEVEFVAVSEVKYF